MSARPGERPTLVEEITSHEFAKRSKRKPLVILPFGSLEEHGEHLPLGTDTFQAVAVANRVAAELDALVLPTVWYGECRTTRNFPGTISLSQETVQAISFDVLSELVRNGIDKAMIITGHAGSGHMAALRLGAQRAVEKHPKLKVMVLSDYDIAYDLKGEEFPEDDGHAGQIETSRVLNLRPELVGKARPRGRTRPPRFMIVSDPEKYFPSGIVGDARCASAGKGARIDDYIVKKLCEIVSRDFGIKRR